MEMPQGQQPPQQAPESGGDNPQMMIERAHSDMQSILKLAQQEAPQQAAKLQDVITQFEQVVAEIAQGGAPQPGPQRDPGGTPVQGGVSGVPVMPGG